MHQEHPQNEKFTDHANFPRNVGKLDKPSGEAGAVGRCGDSIEVSIKVLDDKINDLRYIPNGCVYTVVCASAMSVLAMGQDLEQALEMKPEAVESELGGLPEDHMHCARLAVNALGEAIADYYRRERGHTG